MLSAGETGILNVRKVSEERLMTTVKTLKADVLNVSPFVRAKARNVSFETQPSG